MNTNNLLTKDGLFNKKIVTPVHSIYNKLHALLVYTKLYQEPLNKNQMHKIKLSLLKFIENFKEFADQASDEVRSAAPRVYSNAR